MENKTINSERLPFIKEKKQATPSSAKKKSRRVPCLLEIVPPEEKISAKTVLYLPEVAKLLNTKKHCLINDNPTTLRPSDILNLYNWITPHFAERGMIAMTEEGKRCSVDDPRAKYFSIIGAIFKVYGHGEKNQVLINKLILQIQDFIQTRSIADWEMQRDRTKNQVLSVLYHLKQ